MSNVELDEEQLQRKKMEEALEVKSLRRIISAYLNYPDAAEADVNRYERSFRKLPPAHKSLLSHLPSKYRSLRRCISANTYFIFNMLQAFEPPLDMSIDVGNCEHDHLKCCPDDHHHHQDSSYSDGCQRSTEETMARPTMDQIDSCAEIDGIDRSTRGTTNAEKFDFVDNKQGEQPPGHKSDPEYEGAGLSAINDGSYQERQHRTPNGNVTSFSCDWLDPSLQLDVPLVDVDKLPSGPSVRLDLVTATVLQLSALAEVKSLLADLVRCIIRNIVRDWASEGQVERDQCYQPILEELDRLFPTRSKDSPPCCLVPGAGLGRLALEISRLGFVCQGNEFSYYMMICSSFILNHSDSVGDWTIYPWIHSNCNSLSDEDQLRPVSIPDILPASAGITEGFSMCGGDFVEVYSDPAQEGVWDAVVTCFFIDTAHNVAEYIEIIWKILKDGGVWINLGPLLYHFADTYGDNEMSVELSLEDVKKVAFHYGFTLERETTIQTTYTTNPRSMMQNRYFAAFWTMTKKVGNKVTEKHDAE